MVYPTCVVHAQDVGAFFTESWVERALLPFCQASHYNLCGIHQKQASQT
jgi:hypothetical protein